jgi:hypothetical protein
VSKEATVEPGQRVYEAWIRRYFNAGHKACDTWHDLGDRERDAWVTAEQAAAEKAWDEGAEAGMGYLNVSFASTVLSRANPYRQPPKGDGDGE